MKRLDHFAALIVVAAIVALSLWPLKGHGEGGDAEGQAEEGGHAVQWGYEGERGPEYWGELSPAFAACEAGRMQSPIDIAADGTGLVLSLPSLDFAYREAPLRILHNGHTVQFNYAPGSILSVQGKEYELLQFHFHVPSEHTVDGGAYPMEAHFVHRDSLGGLAVVAVLIEEGAANAALAEAWARLPAGEGAEMEVADASIDAAAILPPDRRYRHYKGSLTTPPCSEGVRWFVLSEPISMSAAQIQRFQEAVGPNARPVQPLNARLLIGAG